MKNSTDGRRDHVARVNDGGKLLVGEELRMLRKGSLRDCLSRRAFCAGAAGFLVASPRRAEASEFYHGKTVTLGIGSTAGDGYDNYGRLLARFLGKYIPGNPNIIVENVPGASSLTLLGKLIGTAPRDGTYIGAVYREVVLEPIFQRFPGSLSLRSFHDLNWIGSMDRNISAIAVSASSPIRAIEDLYHTELVVGGAGPTGSFETTANALRNLAGMKIRIVSGYRGSQPAVLAMQRGEIEGLVDWDLSTIKVSFPHLLSEQRIRLIALIAPPSVAQKPELDAEFSTIPLLSEALNFKENHRLRDVLDVLLSPKAMGRPFVAPPGIPEDKLRVLRTAFAQTLQDRDFLSAAARSKFSISLVRGEDIESLLRKLNEFKPEVLSLAGRAISRLDGPPGQLKSELDHI